MIIRHATPGDLDCLMDLYAAARSFMAEHGNPNQWWGGYPTREMLEQDLAMNQLYVCVDEEEICAAFVLAVGEDPTYAVIEGAWKNDRPYGTLHRIASSGKKSRTTDHIVAWAFEKMGNLRGDTHELNEAMQHAFERNGFERCGIIYVDDGTPRIAYHKTK